MKTRSSHPERKAMLKALRTGVVPFRAHLDECEACRSLFALLSDFPVAGMPPLANVSADSVAAAEAVPLAHSNLPARRVVSGRMTFDSWSDRPALEIRNAGAGLTRRLCLKAGRLSLEIVAERTLEGWDFVARVYSAKKAVSGYSLRIGTRNVLPRSQGFYHWSSKAAPRTLELIGTADRFRFEGLSWG